MFTDVWVGRAIGDLLDACFRWPPDLVIHEEEEYAGPLLASFLGVPCVTQSWAAPARPAAGRAAAVNALTPIWDRYAPGRAPRRVGDLYLDACPPALQSADIGDIARSTQVYGVRPSLFDGPPSPPPAFLTDLPRPAVYVTLGTVAVFSEPGLLSRISTALSARFASVLVTTGPNPVSAFTELPENVTPVTYTPQSQILPTVDLLVSHGGAGGTCGALLQALPHLVLPGLGQSQITIAEAIHRLGLGIRLDPAHRSDTAIAEAAERLVTDANVHARLRALQAQLMTLPGPQDTLPVVLAAASLGAPTPQDLGSP